MWTFTFQSRWQYSITCYCLGKLQSSPVLKKQIVLLACTSVIVSACLSTHSNSTAVLLSHMYSQTMKWLHGDVTNSCLIPSLWMAWEWGKISLCSLAYATTCLLGFTTSYLMHYTNLSRCITLKFKGFTIWTITLFIVLTVSYILHAHIHTDWLCYDDDKVLKLPESNVVSKYAYILFYCRRDYLQTKP